MTEVIKMPPHEGDFDAPLSQGERILAQRNIVAGIEGTDEEERRRLVEENSPPFRVLENDPEFRRLVREGDFKEARARLEAFKEEQKQKKAS